MKDIDRLPGRLAREAEAERRLEAQEQNARLAAEESRHFAEIPVEVAALLSDLEERGRPGVVGREIQTRSAYGIDVVMVDGWELGPYGDGEGTVYLLVDGTFNLAGGANHTSSRMADDLYVRRFLPDLRRGLAALRERLDGAS